MQEKTKQKQVLTLEDRKNLSITDVTEVVSSDESTVKLCTTYGKLLITGTGLTINQINVETGEFSLSGEVKKIEYKNSHSKGKFSSLFK